MERFFNQILTAHEANEIRHTEMHSSFDEVEVVVKKWKAMNFGY
jgi:hypothetical protein